jgi:hypothetical protein
LGNSFIVVTIELQVLGTTPSSVTNFLIHTPSLAASETAMYSASVVESVVVFCLELFQLIAPSLSINTNSDYDLRSS